MDVDQETQAGPSTIRDADVKASRRPRQKKPKAERALLREAEAQTTKSSSKGVFSVDEEVNAEAGSSRRKLKGSSSATADASSSEKKKKRKDKGRRRHAQDAEEGQNDLLSGSAALGVTADSAEVNAGKPEKGRRRKEKTAHGWRVGYDIEAISGGEEWKCHPLAQGSVSRVPPVWSKDGRYYITAEDRSLHINSSSAPYDRLSTLSSTHPDGHKASITAVLLSPVNSQHVLTAAQDGRVLIWDYTTGKLVHILQAVQTGKVNQMCIGKVGGKWQIFVTVTPAKTKGNKDPSHSVLRLRYPTSNPSGTPIPITDRHTLGKCSNPPTSLFIAPTSQYLIALAGNKAYTYLLPVNAATTNDKWSAQCVKYVSDQPLTCGAFAPTDKLQKDREDWFATGDEKGVIRLWHGLARAFKLVGNHSSQKGSNGSGHGAGQGQADVQKRLPTTSLHWHAHAVAAIAFTPSGSQLLSVGEESVLVQWHLASGKREYIPRLGGRPIISLAIKSGHRAQEEEWWMSLQDGSVMKVGAGSGTIQSVGRGVRLDPFRQSTTPTSSASTSTSITTKIQPYPLSVHPSTKALVLPSSHPSTLQWVDTAQSSVLFDLEVAPSNRVNRRDEKELEAVAVERVAFSAAVNGVAEWMATVEARRGDEYEGAGRVCVMKMWRWEGAKYVVNTQYPRPHGLADITALTFSHVETPQDRPLLFTSDDQGVCKTWMIRQAKKSEHGKTAAKRAGGFELYWAQRSSWTYRSFTVRSAAFSADGTILALAHGPVVSLWDTDSNALLTVLDVPHDVDELLFVGDEGRWLVGAGKCLIVWDILSCEPAWLVPGIHTHLLPHPRGFISTSPVSSQTIISLFSPTSTDRKPIFEKSIDTPSFRSLVRLPSSSSSTSSLGLTFIGVTSTGEVVRFGDASTPLPALSAALTPRSGSGEVGRKSIWQEMFGERAFITSTSTSLEDAEADAYASAEQVKATTTTLTRTTKVAGTGRPSDVFEGPSHTLPPLSTLFDAFIDEVLAVPVVQPQMAVSAAGVGVNGVVGDQGGILLPDGNGADEEASGDGMLGKLDSTDGLVGRKVRDEEVHELEGFFRTLLSSSGGPKTSARQTKRSSIGGAGASAKAGSKANANANANANGSASASASAIASPITKAPQAQSKVVNGGADIDDDDEDAREVAGAANGTPSSAGKKGKKRRAPRDSVAGH